MSKLLRIILQPIREQKVLFAFLLLMCCVVIPVMCYVTGAFPKPFVFAPPIFDCYLLTLLAYWLKRIRLSWLVWLLSILLLGGEVFSIIIYQSPYSMTVLQLILETHPREATEFLGGYGVAGKMALAVGITCAVLLVSVALLRLLSIMPRLRRACLILIAVLLPVSALCQGYSYYRVYQSYTASVTSRVAEIKYAPLRNSPLIRFLYGHALNIVSTKELRALVHTVRATEVDSCSFRSPVILFVVGESYNKYHSPLYNPNARQTTPNFCRMKEQGNLICFDDAVSPFNVTSKTLRQMFSTYYPGCGREWVNCTLFPAVFRKAGYHVWYITNHFVGEKNKVHTQHVGGTIFNQSELRQMQFSAMNDNTTRYDMDLFPYLPSVDTLAVQPSLLIFHPAGQHEDYRERYPEAYNHFTVDSIKNDFTNERGRQIVAEYDNATLYNDAVVAALFEKYASLDMVGIYLPDHGEEVYDWRNSCYRTNSDQMTPEIARYQYEVPLLFYVSDTFKTNHPDLVGEIEAACHRPFISSLMPFVLFHLAGINHVDYESSRDILSPDYDEHFPRIIREDVDYDELMKQ